ncbi:MAG: glycosyltransferase family 2 protein [Anaerolineae bacterium]
MAGVLPPAWVVIPTYWGPFGTAIYDHPTPLDGQSTLPRLLNSLTRQENAPDFSVLILVSAVAPQYEKAATARVRDLLIPYSDRLNLTLADANTAQLIDNHFQAHGFDAQIARMRGYAAVRNMQLLVPAVLGAEVIIALDDDEVVTPDYLRRAVKWSGTSFKSQPVTGIAGLYLDAAGSPYLPETPRSDNIFADKPIYMNQTVKGLAEQHGHLIETPMALGGNMVFHQRLFKQVSFDPGITRGEDIDYLINARLAGQTFYLDQQLTITHLPPRQYEAPSYGKLRQDVFRFVYEKEKLRLGNLAPKAFYPYPGRFLEADVLAQARQALQMAATPDMVTRFGNPEAILTAAQRHAGEQAPRYFDFARRWTEIMATLTNETTLPDKLRLVLPVKAG